MASVLKNMAKLPRDKFLQSIMVSLHKLQQTLEQLNAQTEAIHSAQLEINHHHTEALKELNGRVKNSGTLVLSDTEIVTKIFSGLKMYLDPRDLAITPHLALDSIWEHRVTAAWLAVVEPNDTVFEIGSNNGYYGALAAQRTDKKKSKVVLFEANPQLIPYIRKTLAVNWLNEQTVLEQLAIADKEGELTLHVLKDYVGSSSILPPEQLSTYLGDKMYLETQEAVKVPAMTIDNYCRKHNIPTVDLMIMDIEGYEDKAYAGMRQTVLASPRVTLFIEFTKESYADPEQFYMQMLQDFGHVYAINDDGYIIKPKRTSYEAVIGGSDDWVMPIFSKRSDLAG